MVEEDDQMKINHVWPLLISINPIWRPIRNFEFSSWYNTQMNPKMVSTFGFYDINELHRSPVIRNYRIPNYNYWAFLIINVISLN